jgi:hypothetical protein
MALPRLCEVGSEVPLSLRVVGSGAQGRVEVRDGLFHAPQAEENADAPRAKRSTANEPIGPAPITAT